MAPMQLFYNVKAGGVKNKLTVFSKDAAADFVPMGQRPRGCETRVFVLPIFFVKNIAPFEHSGWYHDCKVQMARGKPVNDSAAPWLGTTGTRARHACGYQQPSDAVFTTLDNSTETRSIGEEFYYCDWGCRRLGSSRLPYIPYHETSFWLSESVVYWFSIHGNLNTQWSILRIPPFLRYAGHGESQGGPG